ncbi:MAG: hypothetical protein WDA77_13910 [Acidimicrobiia bacterium]|jgi:hypothetical protein|nr:hypothetical protein [Acholeplasmataceae bacterium]HQD92785.1 hypothetical protein [Bacilli bacterium]
MKQLEKKFKNLLLIPVLGAILCLGSVYVRRKKYEKATLKIIYGYMILYGFLTIVSFGFAVLISFIFGIKNSNIAMLIMWFIDWVLLDIAFINMYNLYLS